VLLGLGFRPRFIEEGQGDGGAPIPFVTAYLAFAQGAGDRASALAEFADLKKMSRDGTVLPFNLALVHLGLGDRVGALDNLERALAADSQMMPWR